MDGPFKCKLAKEGQKFYAQYKWTLKCTRTLCRKSVHQFKSRNIFDYQYITTTRQSMYLQYIHICNTDRGGHDFGLFSGARGGGKGVGEGRGGGGGREGRPFLPPPGSLKGFPTV